MTGRICAIAVLTSLFLASCDNPARSAAPDEDDIKQYVQSQLPEAVLLGDIEFKNFENPDRSSGRTSVKGLFVFAENLYLQRGHKYFGMKLVENGIKGWGINNRYQIIFGKDRGFSNPIYLVIYPNFRRSQIKEFTAELTYQETIDGFSFRGKLEHDKIVGETLTDIRERLSKYGSRKAQGILEEYTPEFDAAIKQFTDITNVPETYRMR